MRPKDRQTARSPPMNAKTVVDGDAAETNNMAKAAPALAPEALDMSTEEFFQSCFQWFKDTNLKANHN